MKISHYDPSLGGVNCARFINGECVSKMANGERGQDYYYSNDTIACPSELPFDTVLVIFGKEYTCRDRGGAIVENGGVYWIDILGKDAIVPFGTIVDAYIKE